MSLKKSVTIQLRVIGALIMREILTRYGRHNLGFLWLFLEPAMFTMGIVVLWSFTSTHSGGVSVVAFAITGYSYVLMWRNIANRCANAIEPNLSLMYHHNVKVIDIFLSRIFLEIAGTTISFVILSTIFIFLNLMPIPQDVFLMIQAWLLLSLFATSLGFCVGVISEISEVFDRIWHTLTYLFFPLSGAVFFVHTIPPGFRNAALYIPPLHAIEMLRHGYFGSKIPTYEEPLYLLTVSIVLLFLGLVGINWISKRVQPE